MGRTWNIRMQKLPAVVSTSTDRARTTANGRHEGHHQVQWNLNPTLP
ncbi:hypothetical protein QIS74_06762 [Colletotrichum tabaci]|uniref:Uncharacterized protein n=1 Tax=Colletotrichum tabaci TaxID=1209068 RepID=A0AAV9TA58_9PEZI